MKAWWRHYGVSLLMQEQMAVSSWKLIRGYLLITLFVIMIKVGLDRIFQKFFFSTEMFICPRVSFNCFTGNVITYYLNYYVFIFFVVLNTFFFNNFNVSLITTIEHIFAWTPVNICSS